MESLAQNKEKIINDAEGQRLGFQNEEWYETNKNNFCNSLKNNYPNLLPDFARKIINEGKILPDNYLNFKPDEFIRYGYLEQVNVSVPGMGPIPFWVVRIPAGLELYHSSRSVGLNHSDFPIADYSNQLSTTENFKRVVDHCPPEKFLGHREPDVINKNICTYISYYSTPIATKEYLTKDYGFGGEQIKYAYGVNLSKTPDDRLKFQSDEYGYGIQAYTLKQDRYFVIVGLDDLLTERPDLGRYNMTNFRQIMEFLSPTIKQQMFVSDEGMNNFLNLLSAVTGIGSLQDNAYHLLKDYPRYYRNIYNIFTEWVNMLGNTYYYNTPTNTAGYIKNIAQGVSQNAQLNKYKGVRFSTYEHDRPIMNMLGWLFGSYPITDYNNNQVTVVGFLSSSLFVPKGNSFISSISQIGELFYYEPLEKFHSEIGMFYAPTSLERNKNNKYDLNYSLNYEGITQEFRKYKTSNIMRYIPSNITGDKSLVDNFHQGHLMEHSTWVGLIGASMSDKQPFNTYLKNNIPKDTYLIAGYIHDIGKSGECVKTSVYKGLDLHNPLPSVCSFVTNSDEILGMKYYDIPEHPEKGYEYLKGYKVYNKFTLDGLKSIESYVNSTIPTYFDDWERMFKHLKVDSYNKRLIRIVAATHWYYGNAISKLSKGSQSNDIIVSDFIDKIELFYNDEFFELDKEDFLKVIIFVIALSVADIIGSEYNEKLDPEKLSDAQRATLINYLPNFSQYDYYNPNDTLNNIVEQITDYALGLNNTAVWKQDIINNVKNNLDSFITMVMFKLQSFTFNPNNNYSLLYNLTNSYMDISDIKFAYPSKFPKVITFDLDQTLFASIFGRNRMTEYYIYPDTYKVIELVQKVRKQYFPDNPTYVGITSRHYSPKALMMLLNSPIYKGVTNPLYYTNFDFVISRYTGPVSKIQSDVINYNNFFQYNGYPNDGFIMDTSNKSYTTIPDNSPDFMDLDKMSKHGHFDQIREKYDVKYPDILSFDDDRKYFTEEGLGLAKDVKMAGVLTSRDINEQGIRESLFKLGVAYYVFDKLKQS